MYTMNKPKIYISSPYTIGDAGSNVKKQIDLAHLLMDLGFAPFVPLLSHFLHISRPRPYQDWISWDLEWIRPCDALIRLKGISKGADVEVAFAKKNNIPVFYTLSELMEYTIMKWDMGIETPCRKTIIDNFEEINNRQSI